ncbi:MAG TPA: response regulator [Sphingobacteriaceae bacterium]
MSVVDEDRKLILIAEDDPDDQLMLVDAFGENQISDRLKFVTSGDEVLDYLNASRKASKLPDLILLDLNMPKVDGRTILKRLKTDPDTRSIPVVILTTSKAKTDEISVIELGASGFFTKPSSFLELVEITSCILQKWLPNNNCLKN